MISRKMGRRNFIQGASWAVLGLSAAPFWSADPSFAKRETSPRLEYRTLGKTGLKVTAVGMGVNKCNDPTVLRRAFELGVNFYDTAHSYWAGRNEEFLGKVFRGKRDKVFIQTKVILKFSEKENRKSVATSLRRLQTDYVDVLLAHSLRKPDDVCSPALTEFLHTMKKEGKARFTGFSSHTNMASLLKAAAKGGCHDVALISYNFTHSNQLKEAVAVAAKARIGVVAMKTQAGGYKAADMGGLSPHQAALKYVLMDQNVATAIPGVSTIEQIDECAAVMGTLFSARDADALHQYQEHLRDRICTMCGGCTGECPHGVAYTDILRVVMYHDGYKNARLVEEVSRTEGLLEKIKQCSHCLSCTVACRRGLDIRAQIESVRHILT